MASQHPQRWRFNRGRGNSGFRSGQNRFPYKLGSNEIYGQKGLGINGSNTDTCTGTIRRERASLNPCDVNGYWLRCTFCDSVRHFRRDAEENSKNVLEVENERKPALQKEEDINKVTEYISEEHDVLYV